MAPVIAVKLDHVPMARPRLSSSKEALMIARLPGTSSAPPTPCNARAMMSCSMLAADPHQIDADAKRAMPMQKTPPPAKAVAHRASDQKQRGEEKCV